MSLIDPPGTHRHRSAARTRRGMSPWVVTAILAVLAAGIIAALLLARAMRDDPPPWVGGVGVQPVPTAPTAPTAVPDLPEDAFAGDGGPADPVRTYVVGPQVRPGTYTTPGALDPKTSGRWEKWRLRAVGQPPTSAGKGEVVGPVTVTLRDGEVLTTSGFQPWARVPEAGDE